MPRYAANTEVPIDRTRLEIEKELRRYGASRFTTGWGRREDGTEVQALEFAAHGRLIRFLLPLPSQSDPEFVSTPKGQKRTSDAARREWERTCRSRWRALLLAIKAKLEAVEVGISEFESEFLAFVVDPRSGKTVGEELRPIIDERYRGIGLDRPLGLPGPSGEGTISEGRAT